MEAIVIACGNCKQANSGVQFSHTKWSRRELAVYFAVVDAGLIPAPFVPDDLCTWKVKSVVTPAFTCTHFRDVWVKSDIGVGYLSRNDEILFSEIPRDIHAKLARLSKAQPAIIPPQVPLRPRGIPEGFRRELDGLAERRKREITGENGQHARELGEIERIFRAACAAGTDWDRQRFLSERKDSIKAENDRHAAESTRIERVFRQDVREASRVHGQASPV